MVGLSVSIEDTENALLEILRRVLPDVPVEAFPAAGVAEAQRRGEQKAHAYGVLHFLSDDMPDVASRKVVREFVFFLGVKGLRDGEKYKGAYTHIDNIRRNAPFSVGGLWNYFPLQVRFLSQTRGVWWFQMRIRGTSIM